MNEERTRERKMEGGKEMERRTTHDDEGNEKGMEGEGERVSSRRGWVRSPRRGCPFAMRQRVHCTRFYVKNVYLREESFERNIDSPATRCVAVSCRQKALRPGKSCFIRAPKREREQYRVGDIEGGKER